jgi:hypothetical protein
LPLAGAVFPPGVDREVARCAFRGSYGVALAAGAFFLLPSTEIFRLAASA